MKTPLQRRFLTVLCLLLSTFCVIAAEISPTGNILYVKKGATGNGSSWENALGELSKALQWAQANKSANLWDANNPLKIYVAKGTYIPSINPVDNTPVSAGNKYNATFLLVKDVQLYGGFAGTETALTDRDLSNVDNATILSGDFNGDDAGFTNNEENAFHVVISAGAVGTAELNGFTLTGGNADGNRNAVIIVNSTVIDQNCGGAIYNMVSSPVLTHVNINGNTAYYGGGIFNNQSSSPVLSNVTISQNIADYTGGGIYNKSSSPVLSNVSISQNTADYYGGGIYNESSSPVLTNVSISSNTADGSGGGIYNKSFSPVLSNVTINGNTAYTGGGIYNESSSPVLTNVSISSNTAVNGGGIFNEKNTSKPQIRNSIIYGNNTGIYNSSGAAPVISYSLVQGLSSTANGNIAGSTDPQFVNATNGDYSLKSTSPLINKGDNTYFATGKTPDLSAITTDIAGNLRIQKGNIDMGAYESPYNTPLAPNASGVIYVTQTGAGSKSGNSWANATNDLQMAIDATNVQQVWVAGGTYKPMYRADNRSDANANDRNNAFVLKKDVQVYGGFAGTETALTDRNLTLSTHTSILSGDLGTATDNTDNAYHVVISAGAMGTAELNGFTLTGGNASDIENITVNSKTIYQYYGGGIYNAFSSPVLTNVSISKNNGGGILNDNSSPILTYVSISENKATNSSGGGIYNAFSSPVLTNVSISANTANHGGGIFNYSSSPVLTNVTISANTATYDGGGIYNDGTSSNPQIRNSIIYGNNTGIYNSNGAAPVISYSLVQGSTDTNNGNMDGSTDPQFVNAANGDYSLKNTSPLINKGDNTYFATGKTPNLSAITTDIAGNARIQKGKIDLGAYESPYSTPLSPDDNNVIYVTETGNGDFTGNSWANATNDLQMAINATGVQQVWVAGGTYKPKYRADDMSDANANDRDNAFVLKKDVQVYGGFAGTETALTDRNLTLSTNASILSGDLGTANVKTDNAYHVVISAGAVGTAELNGFTITNGNANGSLYIKVNTKAILRSSGGGIYNESSSPVLTHVIISANTTTTSGGGISNYVSYPVLTNVSINGNTATTVGGGIYNESSSPVLTNVTISANTADVNGGGIYNTSSSPVLTNVSISKNTAVNGGAMYNNYTESKPQIRNSIIYDNNTGIYNSSGAAPVISYSLVQGLNSTANGNIAGSTDPQFVDAANGDYSLQANSPAVNKGSDTYFDAGQTPNLSAITADLAGNPRIQKGKIDLGAYESAYSTLLSPDDNNVIYVTETGNGDFTGNSWANATDDLQMAIDATNVQQVWVAGGTYKPMYRADNMSGANANDRNNAFVLKKDVQVYGGFAGTETKLTDRDLSLSTNASILSGDLGTATDNTDNAYHVVISAGDVGTAELNGFTLTGGNAYSSEGITVNSRYIYQHGGGAIYNSEYSSPVLSNLTISQNTANLGGGIYNGEYSSPVLSNLSISQNTVNLGGGIYNNENSFPVLSNVSISSNTANFGGGIFNNASSPVLTNVSISSNTTDGDGGGIYNSSSSPVLTNVTISSNTANFGGGMYNADANSNPQIRNSIIYGNSSGIYNDGGIPVISYSLVQGSADTNNGNIDSSTDPQFVNAANGDFSLKASSPAINAGSNALYIGLDANTKDLAGKARLIGTNIDMGAYENQDGALPVTLVNYTAKASGNLVKLQWQTAEERNNKGFVIYRSGDNTLFTPIGEVPVTDNLQPTTYNFTDTNPLNGNNYYKLVQVDKDGTATELGIRTVGFSLSAFSLQLFPNPTTELVHSSFSSNSYNLLTIADLNGRVLQQLQIQAGESSITVSLADYPAGTYLLRFSGKDGAVIKKVVKR